MRRDCRTGAYRLDELSAKAVAPDSWEELTGRAKPLPLAHESRPFTVVASRSHMSGKTEEFIGELGGEHPDLELISAGSLLKLCLVVEGSADTYPRFARTMEWDTAAGHAVCTAAGAEVVEWPGETGLRYNEEALKNPWFLVR